MRKRRQRKPPPIILDPEALARTCLNCGREMADRSCKLVCRCGYFASCNDYV